MSDLIEKKYRVFVFRAIDEPELCKRYIEGHVKVLTDYGITNVTTNNTEWTKHPYIYCTVAEDIDSNILVGGVRIQVSDGVTPLPVEGAVGYMDTNIHLKVKEYALNGGISESCGLWTAKSVKGVGIARYLMWASVASSDQLGFSKMLGICGWHTLKLFNDIGFIIDKSLGDQGDFLYPTEEHIANVIGILDAVTLKHAAKDDQEVMLSMRNKKEQQRVEVTKTFKSTIHYNILYKDIADGPYLSETNYQLDRIKSLCVK